MTARSYAKLLHPKIHTPQRDKVIALSQRWLQANRPPENEASLRFAEVLRYRLAIDRSLVNIPVYDPTPAATIIAQVAAWHMLTAADLIGDSREPWIIDARFDAIAAVALNCRVIGHNRMLTLGEIGRQFGNRDHSTIRSALAKRGIILSGISSAPLRRPSAPRPSAASLCEPPSPA